MRPTASRLVALAASLTMATSAAPAMPSAVAAVAPVHAGYVDPGLRTGDPTAQPVVVRVAPHARAAVALAVTRLGGSVGAALPLVESFAARVPGTALRRLAAEPGVRALTVDAPVRFHELTYDDAHTSSVFAKAAGATRAWDRGLLGENVGVAVIDTGTSSMKDFRGQLVFGPDLSGEGRTVDTFGHGTVMAGVIAGSGFDSHSGKDGSYTGIAPKARLVSVKVAGRNGAVDVSTILQAMHWVAAYREQYNIRVLNLSWGTRSVADPRVDPLNYAVQRLWRLGIVVVVAAGNSGPTPGSVTKPGDDPVVLTVGAYDDRGTVDGADDTLPAWSSRGPTVQGATKPDVVAPGRTLIAARSYASEIEVANPQALVSPSYIKGSGSSQAAAVVSGLVALLLQARPGLTPDQVKDLLRRTARPIAGGLPNEQGAGRVDLAAALDAPAGPASSQQLTAGGLGPLEDSRGGSHVATDCGNDGTLDVIQGEITAQCQAWNGSIWTGSIWTGASWTGSIWTGASWTGASWTGSIWTGGEWTGGSWSGASWTGGSWSGASWTGSEWASVVWTGDRWSSAGFGNGLLGLDVFLTAFWGDRPNHDVPGETPAGAPIGRLRADRGT